MDNNIQVLKFNDNNVRVVEKDGQVWFFGKDVAENLGYLNPRKAIREHVDNEDKIVLSNLDEERNVPLANGGYKDSAIMLNESVVYSLIFSSRLPIAKKFKHWVTSEVLPDIRKHGMYISDKVQKFVIEKPDAFEALMEQYLPTKDKVKALEAQINKES